MVAPFQVAVIGSSVEDRAVAEKCPSEVVDSLLLLAEDPN